MTVTAQSAWRWLDDRFGRPFLTTPPPSSTLRTIAWNSLAVILVGAIRVLTLFLAPAYSDSYCAFRGPQQEGMSYRQGSSWWPLGTRCTYHLRDGTAEVVGPGPASAVPSPVLVALAVVTVGIGLVAPPTRFWRRMAWLVLSPTVPVVLAVASLVLPAPADGVLYVLAVCVGVALVLAVLTAAITYGLHPEGGIAAEPEIRRRADRAPATGRSAGSSAVIRQSPSASAQNTCWASFARRATSQGGAASGGRGGQRPIPIRGGRRPWGSEELWWLFPGAWLGWSLTFTTLALVVWVLAS